MATTAVESTSRRRSAATRSASQTPLYLNRELSWLDWNARVLALAADESAPLLERVKFLAIFANNLDEFYMVRVAGLKRQQAAGLALTRSPDGLTASEQLKQISERVDTLARHHAQLFVDRLLPAFAPAGIRIERWRDLDSGQRLILERVFEERIFPVLTPLAVDPGHPFPYISNLSLNLAVQVADPDTGRSLFARVKVPPLLGRFVSPEEGVFVPLEDVIAAHLAPLFPGMRVIEHHAFRVTRNGELEVEDDDADDLLEALEDELRRRRFSPAVRLEVEHGMPPHVLELLIRELQVGPDDVNHLPGPLNLGGLSELYRIDRPDLKDAPFHPVTPQAFVGVEPGQPDLFAELRETDLLVQHPYDPFAVTIQRFIEQAADDPQVLAIKQTLYRTSGESPIVEALVRAAGRGKQVVVLVEIQARWDEQNNIGWARLLEQAGCHVVYGVIGLKTHAKLCLVVRQEGDHLRRYVHIGTGNYNPTTAKTYEDIGLLTADPALGDDVSNLFNFLTGYSRQTQYRSLMVAPHGLREGIVGLIEREAMRSTTEQAGHITIKVNNILDEAVIDALYRASQRNVQVDLIVRSICALRPGVPEVSENVTVRSNLGRFLEHSRVLAFRNGGEPEVYIGSPDLMHRNLDRRVEALVRVDDAGARERLIEMLGMAMRSNVHSWSLDGNGSWSPVEAADGEPAFDLQAELTGHATSRA